MNGFSAKLQKCNTVLTTKTPFLRWHLINKENDLKWYLGIKIYAVYLVEQSPGDQKNHYHINATD